MENKHFVLVHGACHGAWCWFKLKPRLEAAGHRVTALDLAASGLDKREIVDVGTMHEYTKPLLEFLETKVGSTSEEKVILVGHSLGGISLSLAMEMFPEKISVAVFLTAFMPDTVHQPSYVLDEYNKRTPSESSLDTRFLPFNCYDKDSETSMIFGPKFLSEKLYQLCSPEDIALADMLMRPSSLFGKSLSRANKLTEKGFGSVKRAFIVCEEGQAIPKDYQLWMINNNPVDEVTIMEGVDHTPMLSNPQALSLCLLDIALKHA